MISCCARNVWFPDLTEEGIEPNPGPSSKALARDLTQETIHPQPGPTQFAQHRFCSLNTQGYNNLHSFIKETDLLDADMLCFQESNLTNRQAEDLLALARKKGYRGWTCLGEAKTDSRNRPYVHGGLVTLIRSSLPAHRITEYKDGATALLVVQVGTLRLMNCYCGHHTSWADFISALQESKGVDANAALCVGDFNMTVQKIRQEDANIYFVQDDAGSPVPSRWGSKDCIDFCLCYHARCSQLKFAFEKYSDHKLMQGVIHHSLHTNRDHQYLIPTTCYDTPKDMENVTWKQLIHSVLADLPIPATSDTETEWNDFHAALEDRLWQLLQQYDLKLPPRWRRKGSFLQTASAKELKNKNLTTSFKTRRLRNLVGRLLEIQRQHACGIQCPNLEAKTLKSWPKHVPQAHTWDERLQIASQYLDNHAQEQHASAIQKWKSHMNQGGKYAARWLQNNPRAAIQSIETPTGLQTSPASCLEGIHSYWTDIWHRPLPSFEQAAAAWIEHHPQSEQNEAFEPNQIWTAQALMQTAHHIRGSAAGPDGWTGNEIAFFPLRVWEVYSHLLQRWLQRGIFPMHWRQARQITLPKKPVDVTDGICRVQDTRPITVLSVWWRVITGTLTRHTHLQAWHDSLIDTSQFGAIRGRDLFDAHAELSESFHVKKRILTSLDYRKCFDMVHPKLILHIFQAAGFPVDLCHMLSHVWEHQERFIQLYDAIRPQAAFVSSSLPQGDALSPAALNILLSAPAHHMRQVFGTSFRQSIYLDDRTLLCDNLTVQKAVLSEWHAWSTMFGLEENNSKTVVLCACSSRRNQLAKRDELNKFLHAQTRVLGIDLKQNRRDMGVTAYDRLEQAKIAGNRLAKTFLSWTTRNLLWKTRILAKASWGWIFEAPDKTAKQTMHRLRNSIFPAQRVGSRPLSTILSGHGTDFDFTQNLKAWRSFCQISRQKVLHAQDPWRTKVHRWLKRLGWLPSSTFRWTHSILGTLDALGDKKEQEHKVRESWRRCLFDQFITSKRRDAHLLRSWRYDETSCKFARELFLSGTGDERAVLCGAALSLAAYRKMAKVAVGTCQFCHQVAVPDWHHLCWVCPATGPHPVYPNEIHTARLGWPCQSDNLQKARERLRHMSAVRARVMHVGRAVLTDSS